MGSLQALTPGPLVVHRSMVTAARPRLDLPVPARRHARQGPSGAPRSSAREWSLCHSTTGRGSSVRRAWRRSALGCPRASPTQTYRPPRPTTPARLVRGLRVVRTRLPADKVEGPAPQAPCQAGGDLAAGCHAGFFAEDAAQAAGRGRSPPEDRPPELLGEVVQRQDGESAAPAHRREVVRRDGLEPAALRSGEHDVDVGGSRVRPDVPRRRACR